ncbi:AAA family ATPase [Actinomycetospora sp. OC33-EN08]|uniref:AAA family ATPase n=1 Tax=Actinomycetospora aurantiaca TaxID=3129233 RepID=A0ABU8MQQ3_9PSEU
MTALVGREAEQRVLAALVDGVRASGLRTGSERPAVVLVGEAGTGKTALLGVLEGYAAAVGVRTLGADGCRAESEVPFAALSQLLLPAADLIDELPAHPRAAVTDAVLGGEEAVAPGALHLGVLQLLRRAARRDPVVLVVDDADRLDRESLRALVFVSRRLGPADRIGMVLAGRGDGRVLPGDASLPTVELGPLDDASAALLLDRRPAAPTGAARRDVLRAAAGNPLAIEVLADAGSPLPVELPRRAEALFDAAVRDLPDPVSRLLVVAVAGGGEPVATIQAAAGVPATALGCWGPAEREGLVVVEGATVTFRHPLVRSTVWGLASAEERRRAHLALAAAGDDPELVALHRAEACLTRDEDVAAELAGVAHDAAERGDHRAAAGVWRRAAECSPHPAARLERLRQALGASYAAGDADGVAEQHEAIRAETDDPTVLVFTTLLAAAALMLHGRQREAVRRLQEVVPLIGATTAAGASLLASFLCLAADSSGVPEQRSAADAVMALPAVREAVRRVLADADAPADLMWARATVYDRGEAADLLDRMLVAGRAGPDATANDLQNLGFVADRADDVRRAVELFARAHDRMHHEGPAAFGVPILAALLVEHGRWSAADQVIARWTELAHTRGMHRVAAELAAPRATLAALRGAPDRAHDLVAEARRRIDLADNRLVDLRLRSAAALAAMVDGDRAQAYRQLRAAFTAAGEPLHPGVSPRLVAALAAAASGPGERRDAAMVADRVRTALGTRTSPRLRLLLHHADALVGEEQQAEHHFRLALADPTGQDWPVERATVRLHYGEWLRRRRRPLEAREMLTAALEAFDELGAVALAERVRAELRAAGSAGPKETEREADPLADLTPQQREIVRLAAAGLRNREIADRLFLSPRTVGSHLHHAYPKLGISGRHQLAAVLRAPSSG